jgi:hypothetical protein
LVNRPGFRTTTQLQWSAVEASYISYLLQAALLTVAPGPDDGCPSAAQVQAALATHAPRLLAARAAEDPADQLTLSMGTTAGAPDLTLTLLDGKGRVRLFRTLPASAAGRGRNCAALADTVAFIVDRYFDEVELPAAPERPPPPPSPAPPPPPPAPPAPPPPPPAPPVTPVAPPPPAPAPAPPPVPSPAVPVVPARAPLAPVTGAPPRAFRLSATVGRRFPGSAIDLGGIELKLALGMRLGHLGRLPVTAELSGGIIGIFSRGWEYADSGQVASGSATGVRSGGDLALLLGWPHRWGTLQGGPLLAVEVVWLDSTSAGRKQHETHAGAAAGARFGYQYLWRDRFFLRADVTVAGALARQRIVTASRPEIAIFEAPPAYATLSAGVGVWF